MATLTIADLDNGKRDLQTVDGVANSQAAYVTTRRGGQTTTLYEAIRRIEDRGDSILDSVQSDLEDRGDSMLSDLREHGDSILRNLGFLVPVPYAPGLEVTETNFTVIGPDGNIYAAQAGQVPFTTGAWDAAQWHPIQNDLNDRKLLVFGSLVEAQAAAATLPDGQVVDVAETKTRFDVINGLLINSRPITALSKIAQVVRSVQEKLGKELVSVLDYGAIGDGEPHTLAEKFSTLAMAQVVYPSAQSLSDFLDRHALQKAFDSNKGNLVHIPAGTYLLDDTVYIYAGTSVIGDGSGDEWGVTSNVTTTELKTFGLGVPRVWTDIGEEDTPVGVLVDPPMSVAVVFTGSGCKVANLRLSGGTMSDGSDAWGAGFFNASVRRTKISNVMTDGFFRKSGFYVDATWSNTNSALISLHKNEYGREIASDQANNEISIDRCMLRGGNWGLYIKGTNRTDTSANIWSPGGVSDLVAVGTRFSNRVFGTSPNLDEDSGAYYRDLHNNFQNRYFIGCSFRSTTARSVYLDRGRFESFDGLYGETRSNNSVTQEVSLTIDTLGVQSEFGGGNWDSTSPLIRRVYFTRTQRINDIAEKLRPGATITTDTGSFRALAFGFDTSENRAYAICTTVTGTISPGQIAKQAAGQNSATIVFYATDRSEATRSSGQSRFTSASPLDKINHFGNANAYISDSLRASGSLITQNTVSLSANEDVNLNSEAGIQVNFWINRYGSGNNPQARIRFTGAGFYPYQNTITLGISSNPWGQIYSTSTTISTSDATHKTEPVQISDAMLDAWGEVQPMAWQFLQSVQDKGDAARIHYGPIAQHIRDAFVRHGLMQEGSTDCRHAPLCYDEWDDEFEPVKGTRLNDYGEEETYDTGERVQTRWAGSRWGIRADQCLFLEAAYQRRERASDREEFAQFKQEVLQRLSQLGG